MVLYVHIPFCTSKCGYCAFNSSSEHFNLQEQYIEALIEDIRFALGKGDYCLESVYFGGGTPNTLGVGAYERVFEAIVQNACVKNGAEITMECNPNLVSLEWMEGVRQLGVNRISLGVQSFEEKKLEFLQREHCSYDIFDSIEKIALAGIEDISIDLIYGTPFDTPKFWENEMKGLEVLKLSHLSAYSLSIDRGSSFYTNPPILPQNDYAKEIRAMLEDRGFRQYEVSNYAFSKKSKHNLAYWRGEEYIGCGAGGVGFENGVRYSGVKSITHYIRSPLVKSREILSEEDLKLERLFLGLRCEEGVEAMGLNPERVKILLDEGKCYLKEDYLVASDLFIADEIVLWLLGE